MIKMIAATCRRPGMTHAEFIAYIQRVHAAISREQPVTLRRYTQNHVIDAAFGVGGMATHGMLPVRDSVTELYWDSFPSMGETFAHPHVREKVGPDGPNFADLASTLTLIADEVELPVGAPGSADAKVMHFLRKAPGLGLDAFFERWRQAHDRVMETAPIAAAAVRRAVQNRQRTEGNALLAHFGSQQQELFEGVASLWFDDPATVGLFRHYEAALLRVNADADRTFYVPEQSFFLYTREIDIH